MMCPLSCKVLSVIAGTALALSGALLMVFLIGSIASLTTAPGKNNRVNIIVCKPCW